MLLFYSRSQRRRDSRDRFGGRGGRVNRSVELLEVQPLAEDKSRSSSLPAP